MSERRTRVSADGHHGDPGREPVIVAEADLARGHGVVLVDDRDHAQAQQGLQRGAGVEIAAAGLGVVERDQHLAVAQAASAEALLLGVGEKDLAHRGSRLFLLQPVRAALEAERRRPSAIAPEVTTITCWPRAVSTAMSAASPSSQASRTRPSSSTSSA